MEVFTFLGTLMSIIGGGISIADTIGNVVKVVKSKRSFDDEIRKALEKVTNDDFQRQRLITLSSDILHFAVRKLNNEKIILPPYIDENEFNDFYDKMLSNKETCLFLQTQLQNYKIDKISQKLDDIYAAIKISGLRSYENVLDVNVKRRFLDEASENLIKEKKLYFNELYINKVKNCLDDRKDCLIKAPEGRGKTYLSRIIAYEYHHEHRMEVWFLDFKDENDANSKISIENLDDQLKAWHEFKEKNYLLVLENVHAYSDVNGLQKKINDWIDTTGNHIRFLLNARPTDEGLVDFSGWEDTMVELMPNDTDINAIIDLYSDEIHRLPFGNQEERERFLKRIYPEGSNSIGANLRLLNIYLKTWQNHPEKTYISDIVEPTILKDFIKRYKLETVKDDDINVLLYISCIYQFDIPLHRDLIPKDSSSSLLRFKNKGLLRKANNTYHLPHSVDALYLSKAISLYNDEENYVDEYFKNTKVFVKQFVDTILANSNPRKFEGDFRLLIQGLIQKEEEFQALINELVDWPMAEKIIRNINPGFVVNAFNPQNGHSYQEILEYYKANLDWLKTSILEINPVGLNLLCYNFNKYLKHNIFKDFIKNPIDLNDFLRDNDYVFYGHHILETICDLGEKYKQNLKDYYKQNIDRLKSSFLGLSPTSLYFIYRFFKSDLNIFEDIFKDPKDLENYLRINDKVFHNNAILEAISGMGEEYKHVLIDYYKQNMDRLKSSFLELIPTRLHFIYRFFKSDLNILKDIFEDPCDLDTYLRVNYQDSLRKTLSGQMITAIRNIGDNHRLVLEKYRGQHSNQYDYHFLSSKNGYGISQASINYLYGTNTTFDVLRIDTNKFYFIDVHWGGMQRLIKVIQRNMNDENRQHSLDLVKAIIQKVLEIKGSLSHASAHDLSHFYTNIDAVDHETYQQLIEEESVISDINGRLDAFTCTIPNLYLFGHFYSQPWCKEILEQKINNADDGQIAIIKEWYDKVMEGLKKRSEEGEETEAKGGLLEYIHNKLFIQQQNN